MAYSASQLDAIDKAIAGGALTVEYDGKRVTYRNLDEMRSVRREIVAELAGKPKIRSVLVKTTGDKAL